MAWLVAIAADAIQIGALPLFAIGGLSPADVLLDLSVAAILIRLLGWHWAFLCLHSLQNSSLVLVYSLLGLRLFST